MRSTARIAAALMTTAVVVGGTATSASAQSATVKDRTSDVIRFAGDTDQQGAVLGYTDSVASGADIRSLTVDHGKKKVTVTIKLADLKRDTFVSIAFRPHNKKQPNRVFVNTGRKSGEVYDTKDKTICAVPVKTKFGKGGSVTATIKRSCLGSPTKLRVTAAALRYGTDGSLTIDTLSKSSAGGETYTKALKAG